MLWSLEFRFAGEIALGRPFPREGSSCGACHASLLRAAQLMLEKQRAGETATKPAVSLQGS